MRSVREIVEEAFMYHGRGDLDSAQQIYDQLLGQLDKPDPNVLYGYGTLLAQRQQYGLAVHVLRAAVQVYPDHAATWCNLGNAAKYTGRDDEALKAFDKALTLEPNSVETIASLSGFWINKHEGEKVEQYARQALVIDPHSHPAKMHLAMGLLEQGKLEEAWPLYESRWETAERAKDKRPYQARRWTGEKVKVLAIHGEQGLGDEILFMSLFSKARERADEIVIECATRLVPIFKESFGVRCYATHQELIEAEGEPNAYIPMASLPLVLGRPDGKPFLKRPHFVSTGRPVIGIAWRGGTVRTNTLDRSIRLEQFQPLFEQADADFVSLQYGADDVDVEAEKFGLITGPRDFDSIHRRIAMCDLVISVCQTAVHQAGAMGVDTWVLTPWRAAWRYMGDNMRPFYGCVTLFQQGPDQDWKPVLDRLGEALRVRYASQAA